MNFYKLVIWGSGWGREFRFHWLEVWELAAEPRLLAVWSLGRRRLGRTLVHVGVSPGHRLLGIFDSEGEFHLARLPLLSDTGALGGPAECQDLGSRVLSGRVLPCSMSLRSGVLSYVECGDLESRKRFLHVWDLLDERGAPTGMGIGSRSWRFSFCGHSSATVSVPRPLLRRFVLLKSCSLVLLGCAEKVGGGRGIDGGLLRRPTRGGTVPEPSVGPAADPPPRVSRSALFHVSLTVST